MGFSQKVAADALVLSGRHCCVCRRFRPTQLQIHHIDEQADGGSDSLDNAIAVCVSCHVDVHTNTKLTRRFTKQELIGHRDMTYRMVEQGTLRAPDELFDEQAINFGALRSNNRPLSELAMKLLVSGATAEKDIWLSAHLGGHNLRAGKFSSEMGHGRDRAQAESAIEQLYEMGLIDLHYPDEHSKRGVITTEGYQVADDLVALGHTE